MDTSITTTEWYEPLIEECKSIIVETNFAANWALVEGYWHLGKCIVDNSHDLPVFDLVQLVAKSISKSSRTLYYATQFYQKYPDLTILPDGKDVTWKRVITKYLSNGIQEIKHELNKPNQWVTCPECGHKFEL
jgi:hypothetical protein